MSVTTEQSGATAIRPFHVDMPNDALEAIDGLDIHFIRVKSPHEDALPLIMTNGAT